MICGFKQANVKTVSISPNILYMLDLLPRLHIQHLEIMFKVFVECIFSYCNGVPRIMTKHLMMWNINA